jgi:hypothetical protein
VAMPIQRLEERKPDVIDKIGDTVIKVYGPGVLTEEERQRRHQAIVRAVARCLETATQQQSKP